MTLVRQNVPTMMIAEKAADMIKEQYLGMSSNRNLHQKESFTPKQSKLRGN